MDRIQANIIPKGAGSLSPLMNVKTFVFFSPLKHDKHKQTSLLSKGNLVNISKRGLEGLAALHYFPGTIMVTHKQVWRYCQEPQKPSPLNLLIWRNGKGTWIWVQFSHLKPVCTYSLQQVSNLYIFTLTASV